MTLRELITKIGFQVDEAGARQAEDRVKTMSAGMKLAIGAAVTAVFSIGAAALQAAGDMEMMTTQFEVLLGSTEAAISLMEQLKSFAASTPFSLTDLANGSQQLLSFGVAQEDVIETMRLLGDTAGGNAEKLGALVLAYGKVTTKGKASLEEINMMAERGLPIFDVLSQNLGVTREALFGMISAGEIAADDITQAFRTMTSEGGVFFQGMEKQSLTFQGLVSTMNDNINMMLANLGANFLPVAKDIVRTITTLVQGPLQELTGGLIGALSPALEIIAGLLESVVKAVTPLTTILQALTPIIGSLLKVFQVLDPILAVVTVLLESIGKVMTSILTPVGQLMELFMDLFGALAEIVSLELLEVFAPILDVFEDLGKMVGTILEVIQPLVQAFIKIFALKIAIQLRMALLPLKLILNVLGSIIGFVADLISGLMEGLLPAFEWIEDTVSTLATIAQFLFGELEKFLGGIAGGLMDTAVGIKDAIFGTIMQGIELVKGWIDGLATKVEGVLNWLGGIIAGFWNWILELFPGLGDAIDAIGEMFRAMWESVAKFFMDIWDGIIQAIAAVIEWVNNIPGVDIRIPGINAPEAPSGGTTPPPPTESPLDAISNTVDPYSIGTTDAGRTANVDLRNEININVPAGTDAQAIVPAIREAAREAFTIELKEVLTDAGY